jgi:hypothetical protein
MVEPKPTEVELKHDGAAGNPIGEVGWEVAVLEGYGCSIILAKTLVSLGVDASGLTFPSDRPKKWRRRKVI